MPYILSSRRSQTSEDEFWPGDRIEDRYEVAQVLRGGMGVVYLCYDRELHEPVAIKSFQARFFDNDRAVARFTQEALTWIRLEKHRHIVQARVVRTVRGRPHIFLEHISGPEGLGPDLRSWIDHNRITLDLAVAFGMHIALGMQHAVRQMPGLVHRDLKPANILVTHDEIAKVTDFGLVHSLSPEKVPLEDDSDDQVLRLTRETGIGAQFGGKYFCHDVRVIRLPRHGASCPVGIGVSCSADRQAKAKITADGVFLEQLETNPAQYLPDVNAQKLGGDVVAVDLRRPMAEIRAELSKYPIKTRLALSGPMIVARDIAHAKLKERLDRGEGLPQYVKDHPIYYAGPAKTPKGYASGSFGPTTAGRMDSYVDLFMRHGGSLVTLAKGNRSPAVATACKEHGGFYLGSIGGPAAVLAQENIRKVEVLEYPELGMEAIYEFDVKDMPVTVAVAAQGISVHNTAPAAWSVKIRALKIPVRVA
jgi:tartrate/fumarate subfamily iron-sulfur-dependent hydro-lyase beta chain